MADSADIQCPLCGAASALHWCSKSGFELYRCRACDGIFVSPLPSDAALQEFYENYYKTPQYEGKIDSKIRRASRRIARLGKGAGRTFLDVGCNVGFAVEAARRLGYRATGIEVDSKAVAAGRGFFPEADLRCQDLFAMDGTETFDVLYCSEVIEHVPDPARFVAAMRRLMGPNSVLYLTTPDAGHWSIPQKPDKFAAWDGVRPPEHLYYFNRKSLGRLLSANGLSRQRFGLPWKSTLRVTASP